MSESAVTRVVIKLTLFVLTLIQASLVFAQDQSPSENVTNDPAKRSGVFKQTLPNLDYRKVEVITVEYAPGASSPKHGHDVAVFAYVLEGSVQSQLEGEELKTFKRRDVVGAAGNHARGFSERQ